MIDFSNLTPEQQQFFTQMWEDHEREQKQQGDSINSFVQYIDQRRKQEAANEKAAEVIKSKMV